MDKREWEQREGKQKQRTIRRPRPFPHGVGTARRIGRHVNVGTRSVSGHPVRVLTEASLVCILINSSNGDEGVDLAVCVLAGVWTSKQRWKSGYRAALCFGMVA